MLYRQRVLLLILQHVGRQVTNLQMMKWAFLLSRETPSHGGSSFYQFLPYKYGPYSFTLHQESDALLRNGLLQKDGEDRWQLTNVGRSSTVELPANVISDVRYIISNYGRLSSRELIDLVYERYSWFTVNTEISGKRMRRRPIAVPAIYTAGYEGLTVDGFLNLLMERGISQVVDVRNNPVSRRYGFHKSTLLNLCNLLSIKYRHFPELGIPGSDREDLASLSSYTALFGRYLAGLRSHSAEVDAVIQLLRAEPSVLICMEADPSFCHRGVLAQHIASLTDQPITHLGWPR